MLGEENQFIVDRKYVAEKETTFNLTYDKHLGTKFTISDENDNPVYKYRYGVFAGENKIKDLEKNLLVSFQLDKKTGDKKAKTMFIEFSECKNQPFVTIEDVLEERKLIITVSYNVSGTETYLVIPDKEKAKIYIYKDSINDENLVCHYKRSSSAVDKKKKCPLVIAPGVDTLFMTSLALSTFYYLDIFNLIRRRFLYKYY
ncbi:hypothetical protein PIROE2DRAFT_60710 [Piromyces sp. E2]|nr:hypothetical protein PIROE2DRAFT_60710 [Piromyces sp. E2]|eukprot:OUM64397.1 hypothetical protein PIROE2DRAFT_60710 [Piromyces sp. E2]